MYKRKNPQPRRRNQNYKKNNKIDTKIDKSSKDEFIMTSKKDKKVYA